MYFFLNFHYDFISIVHHLTVSYTIGYMKHMKQFYIICGYTLKIILFLKLKFILNFKFKIKYFRYNLILILYPKL